MDIDSILCPTCGKAVESTRHIFFTCQIARDILHLIISWWNIPYMEVSSYEEWLVWILSLGLSIRHKRIFEGVCYVTWWHIWNFRNKTIFGSESPSKAAIFDEVQSISFYWCCYRCGCLGVILRYKLYVGNPLHVQDSDNSSYALIPFKLLGTENYRILSGAVKLALQARNKYGFVDDTYLKESYATSDVLSAQ
ncbi:RNA-directed DNA polymerase, eukaryota [Tanacetum coccineum]